MRCETAIKFQIIISLLALFQTISPIEEFLQLKSKSKIFKACPNIYLGIFFAIILSD
jgi:hypothetical protein